MRPRTGQTDPGSGRIACNGVPGVCTPTPETGAPGGSVHPSLYSPLVNRRSSSLGCLFEVVETLVLTLVIFFVIQTFVAQPYQVQQNSMERTLERFTTCPGT